MGRSAYLRSLGRSARGLVPSRASLRSWAPGVGVGFGFGIVAQIVEAILQRMLGASWPSWGGLVCSVGGVVLAVITIFAWSACKCVARKSETPIVTTASSVGAPTDVRNDIAAARDRQAAA